MRDDFDGGEAAQLRFGPHVPEQQGAKASALRAIRYKHQIQFWLAYKSQAVETGDRAILIRQVKYVIIDLCRCN